MTLAQLRYVITVSQVGTLSEAAKRLYISQPSLTNAIKELEKEFNIKKEEKLLKDNKDFSNIEIINDKETIIKEVYNYDIPLLKTLVDNAFNKISNGIIFIANIKEGNVNYISRSNCNLSSGELVKEASIKSKGNGGGSNSFAQGGGTDITCVDEIIESIKSRL